MSATYWRAGGQAADRRTAAHGTDGLQCTSLDARDEKVDRSDDRMIRIVELGWMPLDVLISAQNTIRLCTKFSAQNNRKAYCKVI